jgi:RNA polymerase sigma factor (sigma-70 family)
MAQARLQGVLRHLRHLLGPAGLDPPPDGQLLRQFAAQRDEAAFARLVQRHGGMVLGVCRSVLHHAQDAEDAFQATFLLLAQKAAAIRQLDSVAGWLYQVAYRLALKLRAKIARERPHQLQPAAPDPAVSPDDLTWRELQQILHEELDRLPEKYRAPLVLCCLEGQTREAAARLLGWTPGTLKGRLQRAREMLRRRLGRRGLGPAATLLTTLLTLQTAAAVPAVLTKATAQAARAHLAGAAADLSPPVNQLLQEGLHTMFPHQWKWVMALLLTASFFALGAGLWTLPALAGKPDVQQKPPAKSKPDTPPAKLAHVGLTLGRSPSGPTMTVTGRVVDAAGKAVAGAHVAVIGRAKSSLRTHPLEALPRILAQGRADALGRFRLASPRTSRQTYWEVYLLARAAGCGLARAGLDADARRPAVTISLPPEHVVRGRLVDLQGTPARKVTVWVTEITGKRWPRLSPGIDFRNPPRGLAAWPGPATTDARGRFAVRGLAADQTVTLLVSDDRYARQRLVIPAAGKGKARPASFSLAPAFVIAGTVTFADTGKPVPRARLRLMPGRGTLQFEWREQLEVRADARGKFRFSAPPGDYFYLAAYPPAGTPYLLLRKEFARSRQAKVRREITLALPRGVLVRGKVVDQTSGKPVTGAAVRFVPHGDNNRYFRQDVQPWWSTWAIRGVSGPGGEFTIPVLPGPGHLLINGPTPDFIRTAITGKKLYTKRVGIDQWNYPDGVVALNLKPQAGPHRVTVKLRRGVTLKGQLAGPSGQKVARAVLASRAYLPYGLTVQGATLEIKDGRFELHGCDPDKSVPVFVLDPKKKWGAAVELSGKQAGKRVTVKLRPCAKATLRLVDSRGKPVRNMRVHVQLVLTPGTATVDPVTKPGVAADTCYFGNLDREGHGHDKLRTDARGRLTLPALIPGATFMLIGTRPDGGIFNLDKKFTAEVGKTLDLGPVVVQTQLVP